MSDVIKVKASILFDIVEEVLNKDGRAWITITGMSMFPLLRSGVDSVELIKATFEDIRRGDIVLIIRETGVYVLHRVLKKESGCFYIIGDAQRQIEGPIKPSQLIAVVSRIKRNKIEFSSGNAIYRLLSELWLLLIPYRSSITKVFLKLKHIFK